MWDKTKRTFAPIVKFLTYRPKDRKGLAATAGLWVVTVMMMGVALTLVAYATGAYVGAIVAFLVFTRIAQLNVIDIVEDSESFYESVNEGWGTTLEAFRSARDELTRRNAAYDRLLDDYAELQVEYIALYYKDDITGEAQEARALDDYPLPGSPYVV